MYHFEGVKIITFPFTCFINSLLHIENVTSIPWLSDSSVVKMSECNHAKNIKILLCLL